MKLLLLLTAAFAAGGSAFNSRPSCAQEPASTLSVEDVRAVLDAIPPYLPGPEIRTEIDIFGSTSMDALAHGWAAGFNKFHPKAKVVISAEGSESVFDRLAKNPESLGMISRPISAVELQELTSVGLKQPVAIMVGREALGVFVHAANSITALSPEQFNALFCVPDGKEPTTPSTWGTFGVTGELADQPIKILARNPKSGTQSFVRDYLFQGRTLRAAAETCKSNSEVVGTLESTKNGVAIMGLKCGGHSLRLVGLLNGDTAIPCDDHSVLLGRYPLVRPLTLVLDIGQQSEGAKATREYVRYALHQAGQSQNILSGFFPFDPPTLLAEIAKLEPAKPIAAP